MKLFKNRIDAGKLLANKLKHYFNDRGVIVLGIPRGGVVVAYEIAKKLKLSLDIIVVRKIGAPTQPELALGALDPDGEVVWNEEILRDRGEVWDIREIINKEWKELKRREDAYRNGRKQLELSEKTVILVDDGMATGWSALSACKYLKRHGAKVILGLPVASKDALERVKLEDSKVIVLEVPEDFHAVGQFYEQFGDVSDEDVIKILLTGVP